MEGLFYLSILLTVFYITLVVAGFFITVDFFYFIFCQQRISKIFRIPSEIVILCIIPSIILFWSSMGDPIKQVVTTQILAVIYTLTVLSYFISTYIRRIFSPQTESVLILFLLSGYIINIIFLTMLITEYGIAFPLIGCYPMLSILSIALIQQFRRCKKAYKFNKQPIKHS